MQINKTGEIINPYIVLGQTIPEKSKKYGVRVCTAGYDPINNKFIRVYPLMVEQKKHFKRWDFYPELPMKLNPKDSRPESFKLGIDHNKIINQEKKFIKNKNNRINILDSAFIKNKYSSIKQLNNDKKSLAIIRINEIKPYFVDHNRKISTDRQLSLFNDLYKSDDYELTKDGFKYLPRIKFKDDEGYHHDLMYQSWDAYMHQKKLAPRYGVENLWEVLKIKRDKSKFALIGNMNHQRNAWLIITIF